MKHARIIYHIIIYDLADIGHCLKYRGGKRWCWTRKGDRNPAQVDPPEVAGRQAHPQAGRWLHLASLLSGGQRWFPEGGDRPEAAGSSSFLLGIPTRTASKAR
ncbi:hypothetical protein SAY86_009574 [Trapa natans]|uniref:Uncharacterized protein n=1 Tax=Trapa natans TaxID=22666 RepID=A0AAN7KYM1_TRANT|nr:hypothetical protein SAY86_009574 [Trapa natans]